MAEKRCDMIMDHPSSYHASSAALLLAILLCCALVCSATAPQVKYSTVSFSAVIANKHDYHIHYLGRNMGSTSLRTRTSTYKVAAEEERREQRNEARRAA